MVASPQVIDLCFDKFATCHFLQQNHLPAPQTYICLETAKAALQSGALSFPLVVKPRWGSGSLGIEYVQDWDELELAYRYVYKAVMRSLLAEASGADREHCVLIQQRLLGQEYGLDIVNDLAGNPVTTWAKQKLAMRAGETDRAVTVNRADLCQLGQRLGQALGHWGNLDCDVILTPQGPTVLELNPRFGGGYPFSHMAGANLPAALLAWVRGEQPDPTWLQVKPQVVASKYDNLVVV
jgi:carbamoyl-phosphate synthase large subunit